MLATGVPELSSATCARFRRIRTSSLLDYLVHSRLIAEGSAFVIGSTVWAGSAAAKAAELRVVEVRTGVEQADELGNRCQSLAAEGGRAAGATPAGRPRSPGARSLSMSYSRAWSSRAASARQIGLIRARVESRRLVPQQSENVGAETRHPPWRRGECSALRVSQAAGTRT